MFEETEINKLKHPQSSSWQIDKLKKKKGKVFRNWKKQQDVRQKKKV